ncbi:MAG: type VI secretion system baseplate subunit TssK [Candidatus Accumulibacter sp.]|nr:type VI secretion system baseplate subunit TssK [Accumulibacter sp.]
MNLNRPLYWEQGIFLQPQHFQIDQIYHRDARAFMNAHINPWLWGLCSLDINETALEGDHFEVSGVSLLLKEGEWIVFPGNATLVPRPFRASWPNPEQPLPVYIGIAPFRAAGGNVFQTDDPESAPDSYRFTAPLVPDQAPDLHSKGPPADVRSMRYRLRVCFGDEMKDTASRVMIARLIRDGERVRVDRKFIPPLTDVHVSETLTSLLRDLRDVLLSRTHQLEEFKMVGGDVAQSSTGNSLYGVALFSILGVLSRNLPELDQMLAAPRIHPWPVFIMLCRLVGELSVFSATLSPLGETPQGQRAVPPYDHEKLYECFQSACGVITRLVDSLVVGPDFSLTLKLRDGFFETLIPPSARDSSFAYWFLLRSQTDTALAQKVSDLGKLAPCQELRPIVARALPGVRLIHAETPPVGLPRRHDTSYFRIDQSDPLWAKVLEQGDIGFFLPDAPADLWVQLTVIRK